MRDATWKTTTKLILALSVVSLFVACGDKAAESDADVADNLGKVGSVETDAAGMEGMSGMSGMAGQEGMSGMSGMAGQEGMSGMSGMAGQEGMSGMSGMAGQEGMSGMSGMAGQEGMSGMSGMAGMEGMSGMSGMAGEGGADQTALATSKGCLACHQVETKVVGPAYKDVAAKYKDDPTALDTLVAKVKAGGKGNWGEVPMPPNPAVSDEDLKTLVTWVLSL